MGLNVNFNIYVYFEECWKAFVSFFAYFLSWKVVHKNKMQSNLVEVCSRLTGSWTVSPQDFDIIDGDIALVAVPSLGFDDGLVAVDGRNANLGEPPGIIRWTLKYENKRQDRKGEERKGEQL